LRAGIVSLEARPVQPGVLQIYGLTLRLFLRLF
jgi:hypothetical protein